MAKTAQLNQVIALAKGRKAHGIATLTEAYQLFSKLDLYNGLDRRYTPKADDGDQLNPEIKLIQKRVDELVDNGMEAFRSMLDIVATLDQTNCVAKADVTVGETVILTGVPVTTLIFLEKRMVDLENYFSKIPVLDPGEEWTLDSASDTYKSKPTSTVRNTKVKQVIKLADATPEHPEQAQLVEVDQNVGTWAITKFSSAWPAQKRNEVLTRVRKLKDAIISAREVANSVTATDRQIGKQITDFILG